MPRTEEDEIAELQRAVDHFAQDMKARLIDRAKNGKRGWDGAHSEIDLCKQIHEDATEINFTIVPQSKVAPAVDIANRAMMIWYRAYGKDLIHAN